MKIIIKTTYILRSDLKFFGEILQQDNIRPNVTLTRIQTKDILHRKWKMKILKRDIVDKSRLSDVCVCV